MLKFTKKTAWVTAVIACVLALGEVLLAVMGRFFAFYDTLCVLALGSAMLLLAAAEENAGRARRMYVLSGALVLLARFGGWGGALCGALVWPVCAAAQFPPRSARQRNLALCVFAVNAVSYALHFMPLGMVTNICAGAAACVHLLYAVQNIHTEEGVQ